MVRRSGVQRGADPREVRGNRKPCKYTIIREYVKEKKEELDKRAPVRFETVPGLQGQVDWAYLEDYRVNENGTAKKYCFLMILGYSRMR